MTSIERRMLPLRLRLLIGLFLLAAVGNLQAQTFREIDASVSDFGGIGPRSLLSWKPTADGRDNFVFASHVDDLWLLATVEPTHESWRVRNIVRQFGGGRSPVGLLAWQQPDRSRLIVLLSGGHLWQPIPAEAVVFEGDPLRESYRFPLPLLVKSGRVADLDGDGEAELVVVTETATYALDPETGIVLWEYPVGGHDVELAQLDHDAALEVIIGGEHGRVIDGVTRLTEWSYLDGFGRLVGTGRFGDQGSTQFIANPAGRVTVFRSVPWSPLWDFFGRYVSAISVADLDGDGRDEILVGQGNGYPTLVIDTISQAVRHTIETDLNPVAIAVGDLGGDGGGVIGLAQGGYGVLQLSSVLDTDMSWVLQGESDWSNAVALGLFPQDPRVWLFAARSQIPNRVRQIAAFDGTAGWISPASGSESIPFNFAANSMLFTAPGPGIGPMVVIAGGDTYLQPRGVILVVAAESGEPRLQIGGIAGDSVFVDRSIKGMQTFDYDKDGVDDLVVLTRGHGNSAYGVRLHVFSLLTGERLWQSPSIGGSSAWSSGMAVVPATATQPALLVAGLQTSLRAYNTETGLQEWNHPVSNMLFTYNHDAAGGAEFVLIDTDGIVTHLDASTREVLRTYELGGIARSLVPLPGSDALLVQLDGRLRVLEGGEEVAVTPLLGAGYVMASAVVPHGSRYLIAASTTFGYLMLEYDPAGVFADGFD